MCKETGDCTRTPRAGDRSRVRMENVSNTAWPEAKSPVANRVDRRAMALMIGQHERNRETGIDQRVGSRVAGLAAVGVTQCLQQLVVDADTRGGNHTASSGLHER